MLNRFIILLLLSQGLSTMAQVPDLILSNGKIFTSDSSNLHAEALAIRANKILAIGKNEDVLKLAGTGTRLIDLKGHTVIPGINDAHDHIGYGAPVSRFIAFTEPMLPGPSLEQALDSLKIAVKQVPRGTLIQGHIGLRMIEDSTARRAALDKVSPDHPVIFNAPWGHGTIINSRALQMLGIREEMTDPVGGSYERIAGTNKLSGLLKEYAEFDVLRQWHDKLPDSVLIKVFRDYGIAAARFGITSVQNMATSLSLEKSHLVINKAELPFRTRVIRFPGSTASGRQLEHWLKSYTPSSMLEVHGMKWIIDGTPLERGALMREDYSDRAGWRGKLNFPKDTLRSIIKEGASNKEQLLLHLVGDASPELVVEEMLSMHDASFWKPKRVRFEHSDGLMRDQWEKVKRAGIVIVVNPSHFTFAEINHARMGTERAKTYQPLRSLIEYGIPVAIGSDGPNNPYLNIMFAAMHPTNPSEAITREQAVIAYTTGSAYAEFKEKAKGMLRVGMLADLAVLSQDIFSVPLQQLPATYSVMTIVDGKVVFEDGTLVTR